MINFLKASSLKPASVIAVAFSSSAFSSGLFTGVDAGFGLAAVDFDFSAAGFGFAAEGFGCAATDFGLAAGGFGLVVCELPARANRQIIAMVAETFINLKLNTRCRCQNNITKLRFTRQRPILAI